MRSTLLFAGMLLVMAVAWKAPEKNWITERHPHYLLAYTAADNDHKEAYASLIDSGIQTVQSFFNDPYKKDFDVYIHPGRYSLDSAWQKDWNMPTFKSECWMVASGVAAKLDMISPAVWDEQSCEHHYADKVKTQQLITHELFHVYHGQLNPSPDFSDTEDIDWLVEGLATYASGQCDTARMKEIKTAVAANQIPASLDQFWTGKLKYGLSGSIVGYIDKKYGRAMLLQLLQFNKNKKVLETLNTTEAALLEDWKLYMKKQ